MMPTCVLDELSTVWLSARGKQLKDELIEYKHGQKQIFSNIWHMYIKLLSWTPGQHCS